MSSWKGLRIGSGSRGRLRERGMYRMKVSQPMMDANSDVEEMSAWKLATGDGADLPLDAVAPETILGRLEYRCETCGDCFTQPAGLMAHCRAHSGAACRCHGYLVNRVDCSHSVRSDVETSDLDAGLHPCDRCDRGYARVGDLWRHLKKAHSREKAVKSKVRRGRFSPAVCEVKPYKCDICESCFSKPDHLVSHTRSHTGEKRYRCETCDKHFVKHSHLVEHAKTHSGQKPHRCQTCGKGFTQACNLLRHVRTHTGEKPFRCDTCDKRFAEASKLLAHARIHSQDRPFACQQCAKSFTQSVHLVRHLRTHSGEKPFCCDRCGKRFSLSFNLERHVKSH